jgi:hypothetical protein
MRRLLPLLLLLILLAACNTGRNATVGEGMLQKRKYQRGWHIDLHRKPPTRTVAQRRERDHGAPPSNTVMGTPSAAADLVQAVPEPHTPSMMVAATHTRALAGQDMGPILLSQEPQAMVPPQEEPENLMPRKRLQPLAIPSLLLALAGIYLAFLPTTALTATTLWIMGLLTLAIVLSAISLRRIRDRDRSGKAFALVGLMLGMLAAIITTMVIIRTGGL